MKSQQVDDPHKPVNPEKQVNPLFPRSVRLRAVKPAAQTQSSLVQTRSQARRQKQFEEKERSTPEEMQVIDLKIIPKFFELGLGLL